MTLLKRIVENWLIKGKWILMIFIALSLALAAITYFQKQPKKYCTKLYGCTSLLNFTSMFDYFSPVVASMQNQKKDITAKYLGLQESQLKNLNAIILDHVTQVVEEADIRYEFTIVTEFVGDTAGCYAVEQSLIRFIKNNSLLITKCAEKKKAFDEDRKVLRDEIDRVDSLLISFNDKNTLYYETLRQRKVDLTLQLNDYIEEHDEFYDVKVFYGHDKTGQWIADEDKWIELLIYYLLASGGITFLIAIFRDKGLVLDIKSSLKKSGMI